MRPENFCFMPLNGGQNVGASCYFLRLGNSNIILDAGTGKNKGIIFEPDFLSLLTLPFILSLNQIDQIFISHAHLDHTGYLLELMKSAKHAGVYLTKPTKLLIEHQLYDKKFLASSSSNETTEEQRLAAEYLLQKVIEVNYMQEINFHDYTAEFFQAGHIPGAMMTLINYHGRKILYTGDYSLHSTALTGGCLLPNNLEIDTLIMCGLHAKHQNYKRQSDNLYNDINAIFSLANSGKNITCYISQLSKGIEFVKIINSLNKNHIPVFIDNEIMNVIKVMDKLAEPVLTIDNFPVSEFYKHDTGIIITSSGRKIINSAEFQINFSLHEDFEDMSNFIRQLNPRQAVIVHCASAHSEDDMTIEQEIMKDYTCRTQFTFAENGQLYIL